jgi:hypothetical protein
MEPESLWPCLQKPATGSYSEPDQSIPYVPILSLKDPFQYYPPTYVYVALVVSFPSDLPSKILYEFLFHACYMQTAFVVWWAEFLTTEPEVPGSIPGTTRFPEKYWAWNRVHSASRVQLRSNMKEKIAAPVYKTENTILGIRCADHTTPSTRKSWH